MDGVRTMKAMSDFRVLTLPVSAVEDFLKQETQEPSLNVATDSMKRTKKSSCFVFPHVLVHDFIV